MTPRMAVEGGEQLVRDTGEHLTHGGELFRLDELFLEPLKFGYVAAGKNYAFDFSSFHRREG